MNKPTIKYFMYSYCNSNYKSLYTKPILVTRNVCGECWISSIVIKIETHNQIKVVL